MKNKIKQNLESLLLEGRDLSSSDFEQKVDAYLDKKSKEEKVLIRKTLSEIHLSKIQEYKNIAEKISIMEVS